MIKEVMGGFPGSAFNLTGLSLDTASCHPGPQTYRPYRIVGGSRYAIAPEILAQSISCISVTPSDPAYASPTNIMGRLLASPSAVTALTSALDHLLSSSCRSGLRA